MHSSIALIFGTALLSGVTFAQPPQGPPPGFPERQPYCLTDCDADVIANDFAQLISNYTESFAQLVLAENYIDQSDSVNTLIDSGTEAPIPLGNPTFATKAAFLAGQGSQPNVPFEVLNTWHTCDTVIIRWVSTQTPQQVQGIDALIVQPSKVTGTRYQINTVYGEFNSGAWLADLGRPECNATAPAANAAAAAAAAATTAPASRVRRRG